MLSVGAKVPLYQKRRTGNVLLAFCTDVVDKQRGAPVFLSGLSRAHTFNTGSFKRSSAIVTRSDVPSSCLMCVTDPLSDALNDWTILNDEETVWTKPSVVPRKMFAEPEHRQEVSD
jgi:hypothetical protein